MSNKNILAEICTRKRIHVENRKSLASLSDLKLQIQKSSEPKGFLNQLKKSSFPAIICEVKKASPSKGIIRENFNPVDIAQTYKENGASCISCLTDEPYFQGSDKIFSDVRKSCDLPMLRKDFMIDPYQIYESKALGADCILLIVAALTDTELKNLHNLSRELGLDVLIEIHNEEELERALNIPSPQMIGVNNRNLKTLNVDVETSINLADKIPSHIHKVAESGLKDFTTLQSLHNHEYNSFLVGESLMREENIGDALEKLRGIR